MDKLCTQLLNYVSKKKKIHKTQMAVEVFFDSSIISAQLHCGVHSAP